MHGLKEKQCLNYLKEKLTENNNDFKKYFGLTLDDINEINNIITKVEPLNDTSIFPDFVIEEGFIEHFQITSSKENKRNGAQHSRKISEFKKEEELKIKDMIIKNKYEESLSMKFSEHSYEFLKDSFEKNWEHHISSLKNYNGAKNNSIFLIQYNDNALQMCEDVYCNWLDGLSNGDYRTQDKQPYRLSQDQSILKYIYNYKNDIKYVIFIYFNDFEIIKTENIPYLLKIIPWKYKIFSLINPILISNIRKL